MKRITWWPQFWLGLNFNWGLLVSYYSVSEISFNISIILFYIGSVFWTIAYDTIYGFQDIEDDMKIGIKSTSIKFKKNPKIFLILNYFLCFVFWYMSHIYINKRLYNFYYIRFNIFSYNFKFFHFKYKQPYILWKIF